DGERAYAGAGPGRARHTQKDQAMDVLPPRRDADRSAEEGTGRAALSGGPLRLEPVTLRGCFVTLTPLATTDAPALATVGLDPDLWRWIPTPMTSREDMEAYV